MPLELILEAPYNVLLWIRGAKSSTVEPRLTDTP